jgi:lycopene cyclase domain-containing protein
MSYTALGVLAIIVALVADLWVFRTRLVTRRVFWVSYAIIVFFQLLTNGVLTGFRIVRYDGEVIIGSTTPSDGPPPMFGDGRALYAPVEDLMFGFGLVVLTMVLWVWWGRRGVQRLPYSGPPVRGFPGARRLADPADAEPAAVDPPLPPSR